MDPLRLQEAANAVIGAAFDPGQWSSALDQLATAAGAAGVVLLPIKGRVPGVPLSDSVGEMIEYYFQHGWNVRDFRELGIPRMLRTGVMVDQDFITPEEMKSSAYYQELMLPHNLQWFAGVAFRADSEIWCAAIQRTPAQGPFSRREQRHLLGIRASLTAAATIARRVGLARIEGLTAAFEVMDSALILLDRLGCPVFANGKAERLMRETLHVVKGEFTLASSEEQTALRRQISIALANPEDAGPAHHRPVIISREALSPLILQVLTLPRDMLGSFAPAVVMILITDPEHHSPPGEDVLAETFGFTQAEARLASRVACGKSLEACAQQLGLANDTVRTMMKRIMSKSDTHRQGEFIALANRIASDLRKPTSSRP